MKDEKEIKQHPAQIILNSIKDEEKILKLERQLEIASKALKFVARPWPQTGLASDNFDAAKQALKDIQEV